MAISDMLIDAAHDIDDELHLNRTLDPYPDVRARIEALCCEMEALGDALLEIDGSTEPIPQRHRWRYALAG